MMIGDVVDTEIYGPVTIKKIFRSVREMVADGYAIPTGSNNTGFQVNGKAVFGTRRTYAAASPDKRSRNDTVASELPIQGASEADEAPQEEFTYSV